MNAVFMKWAVMNPQTVYLLFLVFFAVSTVGQLYLSVRQSRAVLRHRDRVPAPFADTVALDEHQKAADYALAKQRLARYETIFQATLLLLFTVGGGLNLLALISQKLMSAPLWQGVVLIGLFALVSTVLGWPLALYGTFRLEARFGFNKTTPTTWLVDQVKSMVLAVLIGTPLLLLVIYLMGAVGSRWWLWVWLVWLGFSLLLMWVFPRWIAPLFNKFEPLADNALQERIENLLRRTGFKSKGVFVMDGSKRSGHGNAYFTGLGQNKRIVFFDTLLKDMLPQQVEAVLAHELGHFAHKHIVKQMGVTFALALAVLFVLGLLLPQSAFYGGLGVDYPSHAMALLLFLLVLPVFAFPLSPLAGLMSRRNEFEADRFAARHADGADLIGALIRLYRSNAASLVSDEWYARFYDSHPGARERIAALAVAAKAAKAA